MSTSAHVTPKAWDLLMDNNKFHTEAVIALRCPKVRPVYATYSVLIQVPMRIRMITVEWR